MSDILLSPKFKKFLKHNAEAEFLEGTTSVGKTTVGIIKYMLKVADSSKKLHVLSGLDLGTIEKNIIQPELGIMDIFGNFVEWRSSGNKDHSLPHLTYKTSNGQKIIYVLGYDNKSRWKKALGGQYGCLFIDEINIADMEYVREIFMRADYRMATLNPDDPELQVYHEYINRSRPLDEYKYDAPGEINEYLSAEPMPNWTHWFFSFEHNAALTPEKERNIKSSVPKGTKLYKNKILGLRGRAEGLVFSNFEYDKNVITEYEARQMDFVQYSAGVDTSYSQKTDDTISFIFQGLSSKGKLVTLEEMVMNNKEEKNPFSPSDIAQRLFDFMAYCTNKWGLSRKVHIDNADQATKTEANKLKRAKSTVHEFVDSNKKVKIVDRINLMLGWIENQNYLVVDHCTTHIHEMNTYQWEDDTPEDKNDHTINASQYAFIPIRNKIGYEAKKKSNQANYNALRAGLR